MIALAIAIVVGLAGWVGNILRVASAPLPSDNSEDLLKAAIRTFKSNQVWEKRGPLTVHIDMYGFPDDVAFEAPSIKNVEIQLVERLSVEKLTTKSRIDPFGGRYYVCVYGTAMDSLAPQFTKPKGLHLNFEDEDHGTKYWDARGLSTEPANVKTPATDGKWSYVLMRSSDWKNGQQPTLWPRPDYQADTYRSGRWEATYAAWAGLGTRGVTATDLSGARLPEDLIVVPITLKKN